MEATVAGNQRLWVCLGLAPRVTRISAHCVRPRGDAAPHRPSQLGGQSLSAGSLHCCSRVVLQHLSSSTGPPKDKLTKPWCHRAPLSPMDIPQEQTKKPSYSAQPICQLVGEMVKNKCKGGIFPYSVHLAKLKG